MLLLTSTPDFSPYSFVYPDNRIFDPKQAIKRYNKIIDRRKIEQSPEMNDEGEQRTNHYKKQNYHLPD